MTTQTDDEDLSGFDPAEARKANSRSLRGTILESIADPVTGAMHEADSKLIRFHGSYQQDDRDLREERRKQLLEPAYQFMLRIRIPGGVVTPAQWLALDRLTRELGSGTLRMTSRQTIQIHAVWKENLKTAIAAINETLLTTNATSGDVNRNVICSSNPMTARQHEIVLDWARRFSTHLLPKSRAYHELWLDGEKIDPATETEPLYGKRYLPRKFKIAIAVPPTNDVDVLKDDLGFIAIFSGDVLEGFNVAVGGGLANNHGDVTTYPRLADLIGFVTEDQALAVAEQVITVQRDFGNRVSRLHSRLKYTIDRIGLDGFTRELERRLGFALAPVRPHAFDRNGDRFGWTRTDDGLWHLCLHVRAGRVANTAGAPLLDGMLAIAEIHDGQLRVTSNQNVIIANVRSEDRGRIEALAQAHGLDGHARLRPFRLDALSCVALPTCPLAMAEAERYLPTALDRIEALLERHGLLDVPILFRISGCPNGCSRPFLGEIGLVGRAVGRYDLRLGADDRGERLNAIYRENVDEAAMLSALDQVFGRFVAERSPGEGFGDFTRRVGLLD